MRNIGLIGKMGSGKDTAARLLTERFGYERVAFADPLKDMVREADPIVAYEPAGFGPLPIHLSEVLRRMSFEEAKREYTEVRRSLQRIGQGVRRLDPDYWVNLALQSVHAAEKAGFPVVVTDVRYPNEAAALERAGFLMVRIEREQRGAMTMREIRAAMHESETALDNYTAEVTIHNEHNVSALLACVAELPNF